MAKNEACEGVRELFKKYAGDNDTLSKEEFEDLVKKEVDDDRIKKRLLSHISKIFAKKDKDKDGQLTFEEFEKCSRLMNKLKEKKRLGQCLDDSE